ncbi:hypothetical protein PIB30_039840 [Stylosanthes scabra]|uniref:Uncharacterized protein n=1 Tax=Stylosanthes scabra TaxID=79078 RepID=A0ABU6TGG9_9FABA|nr:hypothetical protein [Stylosanthes scabra]
MAKVTASSPSFKIRKGSAESNQKGDTGHFDGFVTIAHRKPYSDLFRVVVGLQEDNRRVSSRPALGQLGTYRFLAAV